MIGSAFNPAHRFERSAAGQMGPRGCEPLQFDRPFRIAKSQPDWDAPVVTQVVIGLTPTRLCSADPNRGNLNLAGHYTSGPMGTALLLYGVDPEALALPDPGYYFGEIVGPNTEALVELSINYSQAGGLVNCAWWAIIMGVAAADPVVTVTEMRYYG